MSGLFHVADAVAATVRDPLDFYPTPPAVVGALCTWLASQPGAPGRPGPFLDPAAGRGDLIRAMRDGVWGESFWSAIEIDTARALECEDHAEDVAVGDALVLAWPGAHAVMNPPFRLLDAFWARMVAHREAWGVWCASLVPVAWWSAERRGGYVRPDAVLQLGWRPSFRDRSGPAHKGSQDFAWCVLRPRPSASTTWERLDKPADGESVDSRQGSLWVEKEQVAE